MSHKNIGELIGEAVSTTAILAHEYYCHPETDKSFTDPERRFYAYYNLFNTYLSKQIILVRTLDDVKSMAKKFVALIVEEDKIIKEELESRKSNDN